MDTIGWVADVKEQNCTSLWDESAGRSAVAARLAAQGASIGCVSDATTSGTWDLCDVAMVILQSKHQSAVSDKIPSVSSDGLFGYSNVQLRTGLHVGACANVGIGLRTRNLRLASRILLAMRMSQNAVVQSVLRTFTMICVLLMQRGTGAPVFTSG